MSSIPQSSTFLSCDPFLLSFNFPIPCFVSREFCLLQEPEFVLTSFHILLCPLSPTCSSSSVWVPFFVAHNQKIFCATHSPHHIMSSQMPFTPSSQILFASSCTLLPLPHFMHRHLLAVTHHSVRCFVSLPFLVHKKFIFFLAAAQVLHSLSIPPPNSENWLHTARCAHFFSLLLD